MKSNGGIADNEFIQMCEDYMEEITNKYLLKDT